MSDVKGALALLGSLPQAKTRFGGNVYFADWFLEALAKRVCALFEITHRTVGYKS